MHPLDRPLLLGLLALERQLVSAAELVEAFRDWRERPDQSLSHILALKGKLSAEDMQTLERCVAESSMLCAVGSSDFPSDMATQTWKPGTRSMAAGSEATRSIPGLGTEKPRTKLTGTDESKIRFRPLHLHAQGGLGRVFEAEDLELKRRVALKEIRPDAAGDEWNRRRFVFEAEITGSLEHPGIVPVYGLGVYADGRPFYAMRFIEGETLSAAIARFHKSERPDFGSLEFRQLLSRMVNICNAVAFAHSRGIVHRDLKPQNMMLGPFGETLVVDWGLAKAMAGGAVEQEARKTAANNSPGGGEWGTLAGEIVGTPAYMSPEQAEGRIHQIGPASDVFGLGATLYALLTGQSPQHGAETDVLERVRVGQFAHPRSIQPLTPRPLAAICLKAMATSPPDRYGSALELAADIERWLADEPVLADSEPWTDTAFRWMRKHRTPVAAGTALLLVTAVSLAVSYAFVRKERDIAQTARSNAVAANGRAQQSAAATREVVDQFLIQIADDRWSAIPGFEDVRLEMVRLAVEKYQQLLDQQPSDTALAADAARARRRCANLYRMVGQYEFASKLYEDSIAGYEKLTAGELGESNREQQLCETLIDRANMVQRVSGPKAAEKHMREAVSCAQKLRKNRPNSVAARQVEARAAANLADVLRELGQYDEAIRLAQAASTVHQKVADANPRPPANRISANFAAVSLATLLREADHILEASAVVEDLRGRLRGYLANSPGDSNLRYVSAVADLEAALLNGHRDGPTNSVLTELEQAVSALKTLAQEFPRTASFHRKLGEALSTQAELQYKAGDLTSAADRARQAIEVLEEIDESSGSAAVYHSYLAAAYTAAGQIEVERGNPSAATDHLRRAAKRNEQARVFNDESPMLVEQSRRIAKLLERIP